MTPGWKTRARSIKKLKIKQAPTQPRDLEELHITRLATPGIAGFESENEGVRGQEEAKVQRRR